jgi:hypothetical protein
MTQKLPLSSLGYLIPPEEDDALALGIMINGCRLSLVRDLYGPTTSRDPGTQYVSNLISFSTPRVFQNYSHILSFPTFLHYPT